MYIFKNSDGSLSLAYAGFNPEAPDFKKLDKVDEIYFVSKAYVKQMKLTVLPLSKEEHKKK